jgi:hypothetical protein
LLSGALVYGGQLNHATTYPQPKDRICQIQLAMYIKKSHVAEQVQGLSQTDEVFKMTSCY